MQWGLGTNHPAGQPPLKSAGLYKWGLPSGGSTSVIFREFFFPALR